jgi:hypothetical protein
MTLLAAGFVQPARVGQPAGDRTIAVQQVKYFHTHCRITRNRRSLPISA